MPILDVHFDIVLLLAAESAVGTRIRFFPRVGANVVGHSALVSHNPGAIVADVLPVAEFGSGIIRVRCTIVINEVRQVLDIAVVMFGSFVQLRHCFGIYEGEKLIKTGSFKRFQ